MTEFDAHAQHDAECLLFYQWLRLFRNVRFDAPPVDTITGPQIFEYTATCPVNPAHRISIKMAPGGVITACAECARSHAGNQRLGHTLSRLSGVELVRES